MANSTLQLIVIVVLNATGQLSLKVGSTALSSSSRLFHDPTSILQFPFFIVGTILYGASFLLYVNVLSKVRLSVAYPFIGLTYVMVVLASIVFLDEKVNVKILAGVLVVACGVALIGSGAELKP